MKSQTDLLPWILGGLSVATVAVVITVATAHKSAAPSSPPVGATSTQAAPAPSPSSPATPAPASASAATLGTDASVAPVAAAPAVVPASVPDSQTAQLSAVPAQGQAPVEPEAQSGQIWQCVTNGVKTFSNNPCGEKSTLLEVRAINTMNPTPVVRYARTYAPQPNSPVYDDQNNYADQDAYGEQGADTAVNSYTIVQGLAFLPRRRPDHPHHRPPFHHNPGDNPGRNPGDNPGHNPGHNPPRRN